MTKKQRIKTLADAFTAKPESITVSAGCSFQPIATGTEAAVVADITRRQAHGLAKYGVTVANNPLPFRAWLQHAYEEALDLAVYLKRAMQEMDGPNKTNPLVTPEFIAALQNVKGRDSETWRLNNIQRVSKTKQLKQGKKGKAFSSNLSLNKSRKTKRLASKRKEGKGNRPASPSSFQLPIIAP